MGPLRLAGTRCVVLAAMLAASCVVDARAQPVRRASFDFTGDGTSDLLFWQGTTVTFLDFDPGGVINQHVLGAVEGWSVVGAGDYDGDGKSDLLFRKALVGSIGYWSVVNGTLTRFVPLRWDTGPDWHVVGSLKHTDFNGDGRADILWRSDAGDLGVYSLTGGGAFQFDWVVLGRFPRAWTVVGTGDFDGDGRDDVLWRHSVTGAMRYLRMEPGGATAWLDLGWPLGPEWFVRAIGDFDNDRVADVYLYRPPSGTTNSLEGWWDVNGGTVVAFNVVPIVRSFTSVRGSGDYAGDGSDDLLVSGVLPIPGGHFPLTAELTHMVDGVVTGTTVVPNLFAASAVVGDLLSGQLGPPPSPRRKSYDFTGDGSSDLLFRRTDGLLAYWDIDQGGSRAILGAVDTAWDVVGAGDYNADRNADILFRHASSGAIGYWLVYRGAMQTFVPLLWQVGPDWSLVSSRKGADFNGDGRDDLLLRRNSGELGMYLVTGALQVEWVPLGTLDPAWTVVGTADFTGDGREDVLVRHASTGAVRYARMGPSGIQSWVDLVTSLDSAWYITTLADFNGDGFADIYWRSSASLIEGYWDLANGALNGFRFNRSFQLYPGSSAPTFVSGDYEGDLSEDLLGFVPTNDPDDYGRWRMIQFVDGVDSALDFDIVSPGWMIQ